MATYKQIETAREVRQWIIGIIVPVITTTAILASNPEVRSYVRIKRYQIETAIKNKFKKGGVN